MIERQRRQAKRDVEWMIRKSGLTANVTRPAIAGEGSFFGPHVASETVVASIPIELKDLAPKDLAEIGADAVASVLPDCGIEEQDLVDVKGIRYRATNVKPQDLFGEVTHFDLHLELEKRESDHE